MISLMIILLLPDTTCMAATVSTGAKAEVSQQAGAREVLPYPDPGKADEFGARVRELTDGQGVPVVYDGVGATTFDASLASLAVRGTLALFGAATGPVPPVDPAAAQCRRFGVPDPTVASALHPHRRGISLAGKRVDERDQLGAVTITVGSSYPLADAARAHRDLHERKNIGAVVLLPAIGTG